jgi:hypothetical protein
MESVPVEVLVNSIFTPVPSAGPKLVVNAAWQVMACAKTLDKQQLNTRMEKSLIVFIFVKLNV